MPFLIDWKSRTYFERNCCFDKLMTRVRVWKMVFHLFVWSLIKEFGDIKICSVSTPGVTKWSFSNTWKIKSTLSYCCTQQVISSIYFIFRTTKIQQNKNWPAFITLHIGYEYLRMGYTVSSACYSEEHSFLWFYWHYQAVRTMKHICQVKLCWRSHIHPNLISWMQCPQRHKASSNASSSFSQGTHLI